MSGDFQISLLQLQSVSGCGMFQILIQVYQPIKQFRKRQLSIVCSLTFETGVSV